MTLLHQMSSSVHGSLEPTAQEILISKLSLQFRDTLLKTPARAGEVDFRASDSTNNSISTSDSTSLTLHYEDYRTLHGLLEAEEIECLRAIAQTLNSTNNLQECLLVYTGLRKDTVNLIFEHLIEKMNSKAVCFSKNWEEFGDKIQLWIQVAKICVVNIFVEEKSLYEQIFGGLATIKEGDGFAHIIGSAAAELFGFADSLMMSLKMPQRLEILLPLYQDLLDLMPFLNVLFDRDLCLAKNIHACATGILFRIAQHMTRILSASERQVLGELSVIPISGGNIHPMTEYVIHYMELVSDHRNSLTELMLSLEIDAAKTNYQEHEPTPLKHHAARIIEFLLYNLSYKSSFYEQESLGHLFMMNNIHYVAQRIKTSQRMQEIVDRELYRKLTEKVEQEMLEYVKTTWDRICGCLVRYQRSKSLSSSIKRKFFSANSTKSMKQKFKKFNHRLEDVLQTQAEWAVRDQQLREKLHQCILEKLIPAYCLFLEHFSSRIEKFQYPEIFIKYSVTELYIKILNLFQCQEHL